MSDTHYIFDIDGTVALPGDRVRFLEQDEPDWDSFYEACNKDLAFRPVMLILHALIEAGESIYFLTGRRESVREKTKDWFMTYGIAVADDRLLMRADGDFRHDIVAKPEALEKAGIQLTDIEAVFEDRNSMVKYWRDNGVVCLQVQEGDF